MSEPVVASGADKQPAAMKPHLSYAEFQVNDAAWMAAFEKVRQGIELADGWKVTMLGGDPHPAWVQVGRRKERKMVRRGDVFIHGLLK